MSQSVASRMTRNKMRADWDTVRAVDRSENTAARALGRNVFQVWADMVRANPAAEYVRVAWDILPAETMDDPNNNAVVNNIQALYLTAVQQAAGSRSTRGRCVGGSHKCIHCQAAG
jgi:hypothetical protein